VNAIAPALIETDTSNQQLQPDPNLIPMGRFGSVDDVASVAVMLAMNDYVTWQTGPVNGGWYMSQSRNSAHPSQSRISTSPPFSIFS
jgi:3-oxoacyl-[acyl-carrier protein] reductase